MLGSMTDNEGALWTGAMREAGDGARSCAQQAIGAATQPGGCVKISDNTREMAGPGILLCLFSLRTRLRALTAFKERQIESLRHAEAHILWSPRIH